MFHGPNIQMQEIYVKFEIIKEDQGRDFNSNPILILTKPNNLINTVKLNKSKLRKNDNQKLG